MSAKDTFNFTTMYSYDIIQGVEDGPGRAWPRRPEKFPPPSGPTRSRRSIPELQAMGMYQTNSFPHCCGIAVLSSFGIENSGPVAPTKENLAEFLDDMLARHRKTSTAPSLLMATLNNRQKRDWHDVFMQCGWEEAVTDFFHSATGNRITVYVKKVYEE